MRKYVLIYAAIVIALGIMTGLWRYLHTGKIVVTTDSSDYYVTLTAVKDGQEIDKEYAKQSRGGLNASVPTGTYVVQVQDQRSVLVNKTVAVRVGKTTRYNYASAKTISAEPVTDRNAQALSVDGSQLLYLDADTHKIGRIDSQNSLADSYIEQLFQSVQWVGPDYGIGLDSGGTLYSLEGGSVKKVPIALPVSGSTSYALANNKRLYLLIDKNVYTGFVGSAFTKIHTTEVASPSISASDQAVAIVNLTGAGEEPTEPRVEIIKNDGTVLAKKAIAATRAVWTPGGTRLALINYSGDSGVYDDSLHQQAVLPSKNIKAAVWLSDSALLYSTADTLWSYSLKNHSATKFGQTVKGNISNIVVGGSYAYLVSSSSDGTTISRLGLKGQRVEKSINQLGIYLPADLDQCLVSYVNFTHLTILLRPYSSLSINACRQAAVEKLQSYGLDTDKLSLVVGPILIDAD